MRTGGFRKGWAMSRAPTMSEPGAERPGDASTIRVLLADDQTLVRTGFAMVIDTQPDMEVVAQAADGEQAVAAAHSCQPDVILMDIRMPRLDGLEATTRILTDQGKDAARVVVLTTFDTDEYALRALRAGASGFLLKDVQPEVLLDAVRTVVSGGAVIAPDTTRRLLDSVLLDGRQPRKPSVEQQRRLDLLTARELEVLSEMATGASNVEIAARQFITEATVKSHVGQVLAKLAVRDRVQAVVFAYESGIVR